ncbi:MAG: zinc-ribbon domain-containing protein [Chloroflexi bacterium]|nr:zinc-ribbon domain-containing protein [Chloroflexota bacterium]
METVLAIAMAGIVIAFVGYPLFRPKLDEVEPAQEETRLDEVLSQKEATYSAIAELDFDHAMGNLSDKDYQEVRDRLKLKALTLIKEADELGQSEEAPVPEAAEQPRATDETRAQAANHGGKAASTPRRVPAEKAAEERQGRGKRYCPNCGARFSLGDRFCSGCGSSLERASACPKCGAEHDPDDAFCANCGHRLAKA